MSLQILRTEVSGGLRTQSRKKMDDPVEQISSVFQGHIACISSVSAPVLGGEWPGPWLGLADSSPDCKRLVWTGMSPQVCLPQGPLPQVPLPQGPLPRHMLTVRSHDAGSTDLTPAAETETELLEMFLHNRPGQRGGRGARHRTEGESPLHFLYILTEKEWLRFEEIGSLFVDSVSFELLV
ncbi:unnamed protein product [Pleuronectes platessa]|uniref:Uncharacterized protein n=1 Tax=Pleuronectes platessa TaxID=8262 RepID=A0A9N7UT08_PLEPL|nr:unnamed protein product [Pleuronectes platessa]